MPKSISITFISDLHGYFPNLPKGDLLIIAGDMAATHTVLEWLEFFKWIETLKFKKIIFIGGNHDRFLEQSITSVETREMLGIKEDKFEYLLDSGYTYKGIKIWGSPWSLLFEGVNPKCKAFMGTEEDLKNKYDLIPNDTDILITHTPPFGTLDNTLHGRAGSKSLYKAIERVKPKYHVFGHIHEQGCKRRESNGTKFINASIVCEKYTKKDPSEFITIEYPC